MKLGSKTEIRAAYEVFHREAGSEVGSYVNAYHGSVSRIVCNLDQCLNDVWEGGRKIKKLEG